jgi:hypothetical protein
MLDISNPPTFELDFSPSQDFPENAGYNASNIINQGMDNEILNSRRSTILNGNIVTITDTYNTHVIGDYLNVDSSNKFYVGCPNGMWVGGKVDAVKLETQLNIISNHNIIASGEIHAAGDIVSFSTSDERLKKDILNLTGCLPKILDLNPISFEWNDKQNTYNGKDIGLIAQQVREIAPEIVTERKNGYLAMKYEKVIPLLVGAIQDQQKIIEEMREEINQLKER